MPNKETSGNEAETVIAASVRVEGDFVSQGNVLIEGTVEGSLRTERNLRVGEGAQISADVHAANASVAGEVNGNLEVSERLELEPTARVNGDIRTKALIVANGAQIDGRVAMMSGQEKSEPAEGRKAAKANKQRREPVEELAEQVEAEMAEEKDEKVVNALFGR